MASALLTAMWASAAAADKLRCEQLWAHAAGGPARAEIVAYDATAEQFLVGDSAEHCVLRLDARTGEEVGRWSLAAIGDPTSVAASHGLVAVAVVAPTKTDPGHVALFRSDAKPADTTHVASNVAPLAVLEVGALPDMVTFTPDGRYLLVANEGEPNDDYTIDPPGSVSVIDLAEGPQRAVVRTADFAHFNAERGALEQRGLRIKAPSAKAADGRATVAQDLEPEYIAVSPDGETAWVTLQENNALAIVDVPKAVVTALVPLGLKDHSQPANGLDASTRDGGPHIRPQPVWSLYQPDGIAAYTAADGQTYLLTANEGDSRAYVGFSDEARVGELRLDPALRAKIGAQLDELTVSRVDGDTDGDGDFDRLVAFGGRSLAVWDGAGRLVADSGDAIEQFIARRWPARFNIDGAGGNADVRSPAKGPEPEGVVVGRVGKTKIAFVGLERTSAVAMFDVTVPRKIRLIDILPLSLADDAAEGPHIAPEGLCFVPAEVNPLGVPLLAVGCEVTGTTLLFRVEAAAAARPARGVE